MCGIAGIVHVDPQRPVDPDVVRAMADAIAHRGPDGEGFRVGPGYGLGHRRLAIVDLEGGAQPMGVDGVWVTYNGEIYNFRDLRRELEGLGCRFETHCDTEVLLHGWRQWGTGLAERLRGMFAFVIVDERDRTVYGARDRLGKKPFYYGFDGETLRFCSELKGILADRSVRREVDPEALAQFFCLRYVADPKTILRDLHKLPPAHTLLLRDGRLSIRPYWHLSFAEQPPRDVGDLHEEILAQLDEAVKIRLMGDVPLAPFLSGGIDSYAVVDSMIRTLGRPVKACTVGFEEEAWDERPHARAAAASCGAELVEQVVRTEDLLDQEWFTDTFDEPFGDSSAIPTWHVSRLARRDVVVALSGDGGDESYGGYRRYRFDMMENRTRGYLPRGLWRALGAVYPKADFLPRAVRFKRTFQNLALSADEAYARSVSANLPEEIAPLLAPHLREAMGEPLEPVRKAYRESDAIDPLGRAMACDFKTWLAGDILVKVDRASMAVSLEVRAPFLDHVLVEAAARIPSALKIQDGRTKAILRDALEPRLRKESLGLPKRGFSVPLASWFRGAAGDALEGMVAEGVLEGMMDGGEVRAALERHRRGVRDHGELLWSALALARWLRRWAG